MPDVKVPYGEPGDLKSKTVDEKSYDEGPRDENGNLDANFDKLDENKKLAAWIDHFNKALGVVDAKALAAARIAAASGRPEDSGIRRVQNAKVPARATPRIIGSEQYNRGPVDAAGHIDPNFSSLSDNQKESAWTAADDIPQISQPEVDEADERSDLHGSDMFDPIPLAHPDVAMWEREYVESQTTRKKGLFQKMGQRLGIGRPDTLAMATSSTLKSKGR